VEYLPRIADAELRRLLATNPVVIIDGARATGKTTSAARVAASELRLPRDLALLESDPLTLLRDRPRPVLIDEWQLAGIDVLWTIKAIVDDDPTPGAFILTGSVEPESFGPTYPLTGRAARLVWRPMNVRELRGAGGDGPVLDRIDDGSLFRPGNDAEPAPLEIMMRSGFPGLRALDDPVPALLAYADSIAQRSVEERRDPVRVERVMRVLAEVEAAVVPDERIWRAADVNRETFLRYDAMLRRTHVTQPALAWETNRLKRITSSTKRYFAEPALAAAVSGTTASALHANPNRAGGYFDSFVACQLRPELDAARATLHHLRTKGGEHEIDLVVERQGHILAFEVKAGVRPTASDARHLAWLRRELGGVVAVAAVIHRGTATWQLEPDIWALPVSALWS
jgi:predicted AAA+ superfamily ATPase